MVTVEPSLSWNFKINRGSGRRILSTTNDLNNEDFTVCYTKIEFFVSSKPNNQHYHMIEREINTQQVEEES